ncbi:MAG TPA: hypothetical protein VMP11_09175 [Verrucomicrobiae bacterium]|nr:hypothetical protein [Verrucomicrobiae bacterium]
MNALKLAVIAIALAFPLAIRRHAQTGLRERNETIRRQAEALAGLSVENQGLSNLVIQAETSASRSAAESWALRNDLAHLRATLAQMEHLRREIEQIRAGLDDVAQGREATNINPTALLADEMDLRQARLDRLDQWLADNPGEMIPELQLLSDDDWVRSADRQRVTDDEYRTWMSGVRAWAEQAFAGMMSEALKKYARDNAGQFPRDVGQLQSYFASPIDGAILQRYEIVPAKSLPAFLSSPADEWLITEKSPVNKDLDLRTAVGLKAYRGTVADGRWDSLP